MSTCTSDESAPPARLLRREDLAELFRVHEATIRAWEAAGKLPKALRIQRTSFWSPGAISRFIDGIADEALGSGGAA